MPDILRLVRQFHRRLLRRDAATLSEVQASFMVALEQAQAAFDILAAQLTADGVLRENASLAREYMLRRAAETYDHVSVILQAFANQTGGIITTEQQTRVRLATDEVRQYVELAHANSGIFGTFNRAPIEALQNLVGFLADGSPLATLLDQIPAEGGRAVSDALIRGMTDGASPRTIARSMRGAMSVPNNRALRIARTETMRAHREASQQNYVANDDVVSGWQWLAELSMRTCPVCWAMNGTVHPNSEPFGSHVSCRCSPVPIIPGFGRPIESGETAFARLPESEQARIVDSPTKLEMIRSGEIRLKDLVKETYDPEWGLERTERSLRDLQDGKRYEPARIPRSARIT